MITTSTILYALLGGLFPALIWLQFWLREDRDHPEPKGRIIYTFLFGALAIIPVFFVQRFITTYFNTDGNNWVTVLLWAATEEFFKYIAAYWTALRTRFFDEPIDAIVYTMTAALGFSALENILYVLQPLALGDATQSIVTSNFRFIGASLLHIIASAIVGTLISFAFYKARSLKRIYTFIGLMLAIALHTCFNFFIIANESKYTLIVFASVWVAIILLILIIERIKFIKKTN
jgi:RsiW-degrading membrane proteinase PrsW (M82 family)